MHTFPSLYILVQAFMPSVTRIPRILKCFQWRINY